MQIHIMEIGVGFVFAFWIYEVRAHSDGDGNKILYDLLFAITIYPMQLNSLDKRKNEM